MLYYAFYALVMYAPVLAKNLRVLTIWSEMRFSVVLNMSIWLMVDELKSSKYISKHVIVN